MVHPSDKHFCPLMQKEVFYGGIGGCYEIQEVREDNLDSDLLPFEVDIAKANEVCETCRWYTGDVE